MNSILRGLAAALGAEDVDMTATDESKPAPKDANVVPMDDNVEQAAETAANGHKRELDDGRQELQTNKIPRTDPPASESLDPPVPDPEPLPSSSAIDEMANEVKMDQASTPTAVEMDRGELTTEMRARLEANVAKFLDDETAGPTALGLDTPFIRPAPVFSAPYGGRRLQGLSSIIVAQNKRNIKCFVQTNPNAPCSHARNPRVSPPVPRTAADQLPSAEIPVDLLVVTSFQALRRILAPQVARLLELDTRVEDRGPEYVPRIMKMYYCGYDGIRRDLPTDDGEMDWLGFCASVTHLTAVAVPK